MIQGYPTPTTKIRHNATSSPRNATGVAGAMQTLSLPSLPMVWFRLRPQWTLVVGELIAHGARLAAEELLE